MYSTSKGTRKEILKEWSGISAIIMRILLQSGP